MKVRLGFVSNSSSSSFMIMGIELDVKKALTDDVKEMVMDDEGNQSICEEYYGGDWDDYFDDMDIIDMLENFIEDKLDVEYNSSGTRFIGLPPELMKDHETLYEFKQKIADSINGAIELGVKPEDLAWHTDCWMNN